MTESHRAPYISYGNTNWCNNHYEKETLASNVNTHTSCGQQLPMRKSFTGLKQSIQKSDHYSCSHNSYIWKWPKYRQQEHG